MKFPEHFGYCREQSSVPTPLEHGLMVIDIGGGDSPPPYGQVFLQTAHQCLLGLKKNSTVMAQAEAVKREVTSAGLIARNAIKVSSNQSHGV